ncbi:hypothetical protein PF002_g1497 [Phytophthora fragariae]|uniref:FYVE zinc finger domain-containing protein n=1 Tax=Phytophthora fragariae TaxID=53985 RepID=A0A6A4ACX3_9STRA|nr:hypothetical protein PF002_g1497 [Phytophthora fragariae]KAE9323066.1 hypothetical protein PF001_g4101 [Phytophthora fragariae]
MSSTGSTQPSRGSKVSAFPVPDDYFPDVQLSALEVLELEEKMMLAVKNALADYDMHEAMGPNPSYGKDWKTLGSVADLTTVRQTGDAARCQCRIFGRLQGDYRNFIKFFYSETSSQLFAWNQFMYGNAVDAAVLKNTHTSSSGKPHLYLGIKWTCLQPFALVKKRDTCFLEYMAFTKDLCGRDVGVRVNMPLTLPECPPLPDKMKTKRMQMLIVSIVRPTEGDPHSTELYLMSQNDFAGFAVPGFYFKRLMAKLNDMAMYVDAKLISIHGMMKRSCWVDKKARSGCRLCSRDFTTTRRRQHCRLCGEVRDLDATLLAPGKLGEVEDRPTTLSIFADSGVSTKTDNNDECSDLDESNRAKPSIGLDMSKLVSASQMMRRINVGAFDKDNSDRYQLTTPDATNSRRTITQCIAEQEELLRRLMLAVQDTGRAQP